LRYLLAGSTTKGIGVAQIRECSISLFTPQDVAPFEAGMSAKGGDPRLGCIIDHDAQRIDELKSRYQ
jgi:hypothetical protein